MTCFRSLRPAEVGAAFKALECDLDKVMSSGEEDKAEAEERFKWIREAYEFLSDEEKKAAYDVSGSGDWVLRNDKVVMAAKKDGRTHMMCIIAKDLDTEELGNNYLNYY